MNAKFFLCYVAVGGAVQNNEKLRYILLYYLPPMCKGSFKYIQVCGRYHGHTQSHKQKLFVPK